MSLQLRMSQMFALFTAVLTTLHCGVLATDNENTYMNVLMLGVDDLRPAGQFFGDPEIKVLLGKGVQSVRNPVCNRE